MFCEYNELRTLKKRRGAHTGGVGWRVPQICARALRGCDLSKPPSCLTFGATANTKKGPP